jgi:hypothetical protein
MSPTSNAMWLKATARGLACETGQRLLRRDATKIGVGYVRETSFRSSVRFLPSSGDHQFPGQFIGLHQRLFWQNPGYTTQFHHIGALCQQRGKIQILFDQQN